ncbi:LytTR family DNA-binding domain-containing protein [Chitinophaga sp. CF418]|uniref:LytR/AlgR family response regulator transcription factor n=1 Tax=Chitinophaga sp. CF418 TaxID=1855287 RepID=UPI000920449B|nr:response regulator transcription factor [Chitinophaga sp. CF418]SHN30187.1 two component transcriptional regulator, LytTR family [Chitinophaga sp. CF418]
MKELKVLILEDSPAEADFLESFLRQLGCTEIRLTTALKDAVAAYDEELPDICLIDIYLGDKPDGILFAETINEHREQKRPFIFLTSANDTTTFRLAKFTSPYNYLLKPYNPLELQYAIELALSKFKQETVAPPAQAIPQASDTLFIKKGNLLQRIAIDDIRYIEVDGKYSKVVCHAEKFVIQQSLKDIQVQLPALQFCRVHRNYIVNVKEVIKINVINNEIFFRDGETLFFSRRYIDEFLQAFKIFK